MLASVRRDADQTVLNYVSDPVWTFLCLAGSSKVNANNLVRTEIQQERIKLT